MVDNNAVINLGACSSPGSYQSRGTPPRIRLPRTRRAESSIFRESSIFPMLTDDGRVAAPGEPIWLGFAVKIAQASFSFAAKRTRMTDPLSAVWPRTGGTGEPLLSPHLWRLLACGEDGRSVKCYLVKLSPNFNSHPPPERIYIQFLWI